MSITRNVILTLTVAPFTLILLVFVL
uniref:Uncharacterized protein n=1 Tax=Anguilla anguilla TaxID=7936 RepID=A0A0E9VWW6_ANGAN